MKKYDKLNLTSSIYQDRPFTKSPIPSIKHLHQQELIKKKYQNVCCPNCKYLFRISKDLKQKQKQTKNYQYINKNNRCRNNYQHNYGITINQIQNYPLIKSKQVQIQTEQNLLKSINISPKKQKLSNNFELSQYMLTNKKTDKLPFNLNMKKIITLSTSSFSARNLPENQKQPFLTQRSNQRKQQNSKSFEVININHINHSISKNKSKKQQFPIKKIYKIGIQDSPNKNSQKKNKILNQKISNLKTPQKHQLPIKSQPKLLDDPISNSIKTKLSDDLLQKIYLSQQIGQIIKYQMNLPHELSVPSYCKMLAYQLKDRRQTDTKKQPQIPSFHHPIEQQEDLPRFTTLAKNGHF